MVRNRLSLYIAALKTRFKKPARIAVTFFVYIVAHNAHSQALTLSDVLSATIAKANKEHRQSNIQPLLNEQSSSWLATSPTLGISHLASDLNSGTNENEVKVNLAIKSSLQRRIDKKLKASSQASQSISVANQKLLFSGAIREQIWKIKLAQYQVNNLSKKLDFLNRLERQYQQLFKSSATSQYPLLLIKKEKLASKIAQLEQRAQVGQVLRQYQQLTGLVNLPELINEKNIVLNDQVNTDENENKLLAKHPQIKQLNLQWFEQELQFKLASNNATPWQLSLSAKQLSNNAFDETQFGISAEIPLTFLEVKSQSVNSEWLTAKNNYDLAKQSLWLALKNQFQYLQSQQNILNEKQHLLEESQAISKAIIKETQLLIDAGHLEQEQAIRRMLNAFSSKSQLTLNQLLLLKNTAMLRQAAGISL
jgi:hypothetical protein